MSDPPVRMSSVHFGYGGHSIINNVSLTVYEDDYLLLLGANGSGKSTLLRLGLGLLQPRQGTIELFGKPATDRKAREQVGYVPQRPAISSQVPASVLEVVLSGRAGRNKMRSRRDEKSLAFRALERVRLADLAGERIGELSGGQQQRALIARALANEPKLLMLDEPTAGVDQESHQRFAETLRESNRQGVAIVVAAHDLGAIGGDLTRVVALHQGHIDEIDPSRAREQIGLFVEDHHH